MGWPFTCEPIVNTGPIRDLAGMSSRIIRIRETLMNDGGMLIYYYFWSAV